MKKKTNYAVLLLIACGVFAIISCEKGNGSSTDPNDQDTMGLTVAKASGSLTLPLWGASSAGFPGESISGVASWDRLNSRVKYKNGGTGLSFRRSYGTGMPADFASTDMADDIGRCDVSIGEIKPDFNKSDSENYNLIRDFVLTIPVDHTVYLVYHHEPESKIANGDYTAAQYRSGVANFIRAVISVQNQRPNVHPCFCLMAWTFDPSSGRNPDDYKPDGLNWTERTKTVAGIDVYFDDPSVSASSKCDPIFAKMGLNYGGGSANWGYKRFGIFETSAHGARSGWISAMGAWAKNRGDMEAVSWYNSGLGPHAGPTGWFLGNWGQNPSTGNFWWGDSDGSLNAFAQVAK